MRRFVLIAVFALFSFLGGMAGSLLMNSGVLHAASGDAKLKSLWLYNNAGQKVAFLGPHNQGAGFFYLFNEKGQTEIQMGAYGAGAEKGQTLIGMHDRADHLRFLFRLHGPKDSPTIVMKDQGGRDRIVIGLDGNTEEPYFRVVSKTGGMKDLLR